MFNKAIEILYLAEICKYMKTPHSCHDFGPTLDTELNVNKYVRMLNEMYTRFPKLGEPNYVVVLPPYVSTPPPPHRIGAQKPAHDGQLQPIEKTS